MRIRYARSRRRWPTSLSIRRALHRSSLPRSGRPRDTPSVGSGRSQAHRRLPFGSWPVSTWVGIRSIVRGCPDPASTRPDARHSTAQFSNQRRLPNRPPTQPASKSFGPEQQPTLLDHPRLPPTPNRRWTESYLSSPRASTLMEVARSILGSPTDPHAGTLSISPTGPILRA